MFGRIGYRLKQLFFALTAKMSKEDQNFARQYLDIKEGAIFFNLPEFEQKHSVFVAQKMSEAAKGMMDIDQRKLVRLGLLHDIGKSAVRLSIFDRGMLVVLKRFLPPLYGFFAKRGEPQNAKRIFRKFYVHKNHGEIGSKILKNIGESEDIIREVAMHDSPYPSHDVYMRILDKVDGSY